MGEAPRRREARVAQVVLRADGGRACRAPPATSADGTAGDEEADAGVALGLALRLRWWRRRERASITQEAQFDAERVDPGLESVVEHVADHDHAAARPLAHAAELGVAELGSAVPCPATRAESRVSAASVLTRDAAPRPRRSGAFGVRICMAAVPNRAVTAARLGSPLPDYHGRADLTGQWHAPTGKSGERTIVR